MATFEDAYNTIRDGIKDLSSLDVVTFKGSVRAKLTGDAMPEDFQAVLKLAGQAGADVTLLASTQTKIDGDVLAYFDAAITPEETRAHAELIAIGEKNREATIEFVRRVVQHIT